MEPFLKQDGGVILTVIPEEIASMLLENKTTLAFLKL
jgi:hypothetical protein